MLAPRDQWFLPPSLTQPPAALRVYFAQSPVERVFNPDRKNAHKNIRALKPDTWAVAPK
jgi:hypothetical protein